MTALTFVEPPKDPTLNVLLYGEPGAGKTTGALSAPGPVLYLNAELPSASRYARTLFGHDKVHEVAVGSLAVLRDAYAHLKGGKAPEQTVVVDSLSEVFRVVLEEYSRGGKATLPNYGDTTLDLERFCRSLCYLPVNVVLVAHEITVPDEENGTLERLPTTGTSNPSLGVKLMAMVDVVGYCGVAAASDGEGPDRYVAQLARANGRRAKDRTGALGKVRDVDVDEWTRVAAAALSTPRPDAGANAPSATTDPQEAKAA